LNESCVDEPENAQTMTKIGVSARAWDKLSPNSSKWVINNTNEHTIALTLIDPGSPAGYTYGLCEAGNKKKLTQ
jgi:hypothetical protein